MAPPQELSVPERLVELRRAHRTRQLQELSSGETQPWFSRRTEACPETSASHSATMVS